jgi:hypothetical protein
MKSILVIDDDINIINSLRLTLRDAFPNIRFEYEQDFDSGVEKVASICPDAVVLDLRKDPLPSNLPGEQVWRRIWESRFCPIVVYTAGNGDMDPPIPVNHPYAKRVIKGTTAENELVEVLRGFMPCIDAIDDLRKEVDIVIHHVLRDTAGAGMIDPMVKSQLLHAGRRRIAAMMDEPTTIDGRGLFSWEQYLVPSIGDSPLTGDLLRRQGAQKDDISAYRLILTPSCDIVNTRPEPTLLVAKCEDHSSLIRKMSLNPDTNKRTKTVERICTWVLTPGVYLGYIPLPKYSTVVPAMVANLKNLEVIQFKAIGRTTPDTENYERVASIDSPFREQVAWAFMTTVARPGMPDRDLHAWANEIIDAASSTANPKQPALPQ